MWLLPSLKSATLCELRTGDIVRHASPGGGGADAGKRTSLHPRTKQHRTRLYSAVRYIRVRPVLTLRVASTPFPLLRPVTQSDLLTFGVNTILNRCGGAWTWARRRWRESAPRFTRARLALAKLRKAPHPCIDRMCKIQYYQGIEKRSRHVADKDCVVLRPAGGALA